MFRALNNRAGHYLILIVAWAVLSLINLGKPALWDIDEGLNAEAARVMHVSDDWVKPQFNGELRSAKPALLYWLQATAYRLFGTNELAARLPSALAALLTILLAYELARMMFGAGTGFLTGLILASSFLFCASAHFANPDALLHLCTALTLFLYWRDFESGSQRWLMWTGIANGLGMLAKGPVGFVLPCAVITVHLIWSGQFRRWFHPNLIAGVGLFILVAIPWYAWVAAETKGRFLQEFFLRQNFERFQSPMENHRGPFFYYLVVLCVGFAPWSIFFLPSGWHVWKSRAKKDGEHKPMFDARYRFLLSWVGVYLLFFTLAATKLPNYVLPTYVPVAIIIAHFLVRWRRGEARPPAWMIQLSMLSLALTGVGLTLGLLVGGGSLWPSLTKGRHLPGLEQWAFLGVIPIVVSVALWWLWKKQALKSALALIGCCAIFFTGSIAAWGCLVVDQHKAARPLMAIVEKHQDGGEIRIGAFDYFQPSLVFYSRRTVKKLFSIDEAKTFLEYPIPVYLLIPKKHMESLQKASTGPIHVLGSHYDLYKGVNVVLVTNTTKERHERE